MYTCNQWWRTRRGNSRFGINGGEIERVRFCFLNWPSQSVQHLIIQLQRSQQLGWARPESAAQPTETTRARANTYFSET